jgi:hypothetical protein
MYFRKNRSDTHPGIKLFKNTQKLFHKGSNQVRQSGWRTDQKHSFPKFTSILKDTVTVPAVWVEPAGREVRPGTRARSSYPEEIGAHGRGRSQGVMLQIPVLIDIRMPDGTSLRRDGFTVVVNAHGCIFTMENKLEVGQRIGLVNPRSGVEQSGTVTRVQKSRDGGYAVAFESDRSTSQLWSLMFLPKDRKVERF